MKTKYFNVNGYFVALTKNKSPIVSSNIIVNAGSAHEEPHEWGIAHMLEHNFLKGTKKQNYKEFLSKCAEIGDVNAHTNFTATTYLLTSLNDRIEKALSLLCEMVFEPAFPEEEFEREKTVILDEFKIYQNDPTVYFYDQTTHNLLGYPGHAILGTEDSIKNMKIDYLHQFVKKYYTPNNMIISIVGDFKKNKVLDMLGKLLPFSNEVTTQKEILPEFNWDDYFFNHVSDQSIIELISEGFNAKDIETNKFVSSVFHSGFGGGLHSILFDRIREELGLCYNIYSTHIKWKNFGYNQIFCMLNPKFVPQAKDEMLKLIDKVKKEGFSDKLLSVAKAQCLFNLAEGLQTSTQYNSLFDNYFNLNYVTPLKERMESIANITNNDIIEFANKTFNKIKFCHMSPKE